MPDQFDLIARQAMQKQASVDTDRARVTERRLERMAVREMATDPRWEPILQQIMVLREIHALDGAALADRLSRTFASPTTYGDLMTKLSYARGALSALDAIVGYVVACTREEA